MYSAYSRMNGNRGYDLADRVIYLILRLFEGPGYGEYDLTTYRYRDFNDYHNNISIISELKADFCYQPQLITTSV